jgi:hypothetical protein
VSELSCQSQPRDARKRSSAGRELWWPKLAHGSAVVPREPLRRGPLSLEKGGGELIALTARLNLSRSSSA